MYLKFEDFVLANNAQGPPLATSLTRQGKEVGRNIKCWFKMHNPGQKISLVQLFFFEAMTII